MRRWWRGNSCGCNRSSCCQNCCQNCCFRESCQVSRNGNQCCSLYQRECCRGCGCNCGSENSSRPQIETVCTCSRYIDVPMSIYYGPGYTEVDCCMTQNEILQEISDTLKSGLRSGGCCCCR